MGFSAEHLHRHDPHDLLPTKIVKGIIFSAGALVLGAGVINAALHDNGNNESGTSGQTVNTATEIANHQTAPGVDLFASGAGLPTSPTETPGTPTLSHATST